VVLLQAEDYPSLKALAEVAADELRQVGMNVDVQSGDWGYDQHTARQSRPVAPSPLFRYLRFFGGGSADSRPRCRPRSRTLEGKPERAPQDQ
jgi:peptide/nickel transport system substrate-binding protein